MPAIKNIRHLKTIEHKQQVANKRHYGHYSFSLLFYLLHFTVSNLLFGLFEEID